MGPQMGAWLVLVGYVGRPGLQCRGGGGTWPRAHEAKPRPLTCAASGVAFRRRPCGAVHPARQVRWAPPAPPGHVVATWLVSCWRATSWWWWTGLVSRSGEPGKPSGAGSSSHRRRRRAGPMRGGGVGRLSPAVEQNWSPVCRRQRRAWSIRVSGGAGTGDR